MHVPLLLLVIFVSIQVSDMQAKVLSAAIYRDNYFYFWFKGQKITEDPNNEAIPRNAVNFTDEIDSHNYICITFLCFVMHDTYIFWWMFCC